MRFSTSSGGASFRIEFSELPVALTLIAFFGNDVTTQAFQIPLIGIVIPLLAIDVTLLTVDIPLIPIDVALVGILVALTGMLVAVGGVLIAHLDGVTMPGVAVARHDFLGTIGHGEMPPICSRSSSADCSARRYPTTRSNGHCLPRPDNVATDRRRHVSRCWGL